MITRVRRSNAANRLDERYRPFRSRLTPVLADGWTVGDRQAHDFTLFDFGAQRQTTDFELLMADRLLRGLLGHLQSNEFPALVHYLSDSGGEPVHVFYCQPYRSQFTLSDSYRWVLVA